MNNILAERKRANLTREELGSKIGRSEAAIGKWERGDSSPDLSDAAKLAIVFDCSTDYLAGITDERTPYRKAS